MTQVLIRDKPGSSGMTPGCDSRGRNDLTATRKWNTKRQMQKMGCRERTVAADFLLPAGHLHCVARSPSVVGSRASGISRISDRLALFRINPKLNEALDDCRHTV